MRASLVNVVDHDRPRPRSSSSAGARAPRGCSPGTTARRAVVLVGLWWIERRRLSRARSARAARARCRCAGCSRSACRPSRPTPACTRCRSSTAGTCCAPSPRPPPGCTRSRPSSRPSSSSRCAASSTRGRRSPTRSRTTPSRRGCTRSSRPTTCSPRAPSSPASRCSGRWAVRLLLHHGYFGAHVALPWLALGWALYGLYLIFVVISGRARRTRRNLPAALAGLVVNVLALVVLVPPLGHRRAPGIALVLAYATMIVVIHLLTRRIFTVELRVGPPGAPGRRARRDLGGRRARAADRRRRRVHPARRSRGA